MREIDPQKVLLITNSSIAQSGIDADNYVTQRSLNSAHRLPFAFGTSNAVLTATGLKVSIIPTIAAYMLLHSIECVILSTYTPARVDPQTVIQPGAIFPLASWLAASRYLALYPVGGFPVYWGDITNRNSIPEIIENVSQDWLIQNYFGGPKVPHGRLGAPDYNNATIAELPLLTGGSVYNNAVTSALNAERTSHANDLHVLTRTLSYNPSGQGISAAENAMGYDYSVSKGFNRVPLGSVMYPVTDLLSSSSTTPVSLFSMCLANSFEGVDPSNFTCLPGAWGFAWTSSAGVFASNLLQRGGAAALGSVGEPYAAQLARPQEVLIYAAYYRVPLALAAFLAYSDGCGYTVCGDPLYRPYAVTPITLGVPWAR